MSTATWQKTAEFRDRKLHAVKRAEAALEKASERLRAAMDAYDREVSAHEERGDGFFSGEYHKARKEAVLAQKYHRAKATALSTARAEAEAPTFDEAEAPNQAVRGSEES